MSENETNIVIFVNPNTNEQYLFGGFTSDSMFNKILNTHASSNLNYSGRLKEPNKSLLSCVELKDKSNNDVYIPSVTLKSFILKRRSIKIKQKYFCGDLICTIDDIDLLTDKILINFGPAFSPLWQSLSYMLRMSGEINEMA